MWAVFGVCFPRKNKKTWLLSFEIFPEKKN